MTGASRSLAALACAAAVSWTVSASAEDRRALVESPEVKAAVAKLSPALLKQDPALAACLPKRHQSLAPADWACKVGALRAAAAAEKVDPELPPARNKGLLKRARLVELSLEAADALGHYKPLANAPPELPQWQVAAQAEACRSLQDLFAELLEIPESKPVARVVDQGLDKKLAPRLDRPLKELTCGCHQRTLSLAQAGFLSEREDAVVRARRQFLATGCNLKTSGRETSLAGLKKERTDVDLREHGGSATGATVDLDEAQRVADKRRGDVRMCVDDKERGPAAEDKLARCACPMMTRWRFPKREDPAVLTLKVDVAPKLSPVQLEVTAKGTVERCWVGGKGAAPTAPPP